MKVSRDFVGTLSALVLCASACMAQNRPPATTLIAHNPYFSIWSDSDTFGTLLKANREDVKTVQELLRHANSRITLEVYTQATTSSKRAVQGKVVRMMVPNLGETKGKSHPQIAR